MVTKKSKIIPKGTNKGKKKRERKKLLTAVLNIRIRKNKRKVKTKVESIGTSKVFEKVHKKENGSDD